MKSIYTRVHYYQGLKEFSELTDWLNEHVGPAFTAWDRYPYGKYTEVLVMDDSLAPMVALRWT